MKIVTLGIFLLQLLVTTIALSLTSAKAFQQYEQREKYVLDDEITIQQINIEDGNISLKQLEKEASHFLGENNFAISSHEFNNPYPTPIEDIRLIQSTDFYLTQVSSNFIPFVMGDKAMDSDFLWETGYIINQAGAAKFNNKDSLKQTPIDLGLMNGSQRLINVVENLPHFGRVSSPPPMIYLPLSEKIKSEYTRGFIYTNKYSPEKMTALKIRLKELTPRISFKDPISLGEVLAKHESSRVFYFIATITLVAFATVLSTLSLFFYISNLILSEKFEIGVLQALGAKLHHLYWKSSSRTFLTTIITIILTCPVVALFSSYFQSLNSMTNRHLILGLVCGASITLILVVLASLMPVIKLYKSSIYERLR